MEGNRHGAPDRKARIRWVDAARGLAMLLVIMGHTLPGNPAVIGWIYTFHLPLFFFLSGYASRRPASPEAYLRRQIKSFFQLIVPAVLVHMGLMVYFCVLERNLTPGRLMTYGKRGILQLFWAGAVAYENRPMLGILWFVFALFWGRIIWDAIRLCAEKKSLWLSVGVATAGLAIGRMTYLPQSLDLAMVSVLFLSLGEAYRCAEGLDGGKKAGLLAGAAGVWLVGGLSGVRIDMAVHDYGPYLAAIPVSLCGCVVVCELCRRLEALEGVTTALSHVGRVSLYVFLIHHVDDYFMNLWYRENWWLCCANRMLLLLALATAVWAAVREIKKGLSCMAAKHV